MLAVPKDLNLLGDLGRRLLEDTGGGVLAEHRDCFEAALEQARRRLNLPLPAPEFEVHSGVVESTTTALAVITSVWSAMHPGQ